MRSLRSHLVGLAALAVLPLGACGGVAAATNGSGATPSGSFAQPVNGVPPTVTVKETDQLRFDPSNATVKVGQVVEWVNSGQTAHDVTFVNGPHSDMMTSGATYELKFTQPGSYSYYCSPHKAKGMNGTITVSA